MVFYVIYTSCQTFPSPFVLFTYASEPPLSQVPRDRAPLLTPSLSFPKFSQIPLPFNFLLPCLTLGLLNSFLLLSLSKPLLPLVPTS